MKKTTTILIVILVLVGIIVTALWISKRPSVHNSTQQEVVTTPIVITQNKIEEANFTGTHPSITGSSVVVIQANQYLEKTIADFKVEADSEVPKMREQFGNDAPPAHYSIDFDATLVEGSTTQSIVLDGYRYTGGANGTSFYKVFTTQKVTNTLLMLGDIVPADKQGIFAEYVKNKILAEQEGIFPEEVKKLTFESFKNFSMDDEVLKIYFDKYEIGAGALGAIGFPLLIKDIQQFFTL